MFKFFSNKKKKEAARLEKQDSFYQDGGDDDLGSEQEDDNNMDDEEYRRRVTEEIAKRKSVASGKKVATPTSGAATPSPTASSKPNSAPSTQGKPAAGTSPTNAGRPSATTPTSSRPVSAAVPPGSNRPAPGGSAASPATSPTAAATTQRAAPSGPAQTAVAGPAKAATPVVSPTAVNAARPAVVTSTSATKPTAAPTSAAKPVAALTSAPAAPASPPAAAASAPAAGATAAVPFVPDPKGVQQLVSMGFSVPTVHYALRVRKNRADHAAEFLLEHDEATINRMIASAAKRDAGAAPITGGVPVAVATSAPTVPATTAAAATAKAVTPTAASTATATSTAAPARSLSPIAPPLQSTNGGPSSYSSSSPSASSSDNSPRGPGGGGDAPAVQAAMASIIAKREALKKKQAADQQLRREASMRKVPVESPPKSNSEPSPAGSGAASKAVYDRLSEYKTKGQVAFEGQEAEDRERRESQERRRKALAAGSNPTSPNGSGNPPQLVDVAPSRDSDYIVRPSASAAPLRRTNSASGTAFENLFLKKTKSMIIKEKMDEEEKALQEKRAKRLSGGEGESEVFDKLYAKKLKGQELAEKTEQEEKARLAKVEAQTAGKVGAALPPRDSSPLLKKTKSALFRELDIADSKARFEVLQLMEKEKQPTPRRRSNSFSSDRGSVTARSADGSVSFAKRLSGGLSRNGSGTANGNGENGDSTPDTEDETGDAGADKQSGTVSSLSSPRLDGNGKVAVVPIQGLVPRTPMNYKVVETPDHRWEGRVCAPWRDVGNMILLRGTYPEKVQCVAITAASAPPTYAVQKKSCICKVCEEPFNKYLKAENCRNCGQLVCPDCSTESWPQSMLPETYNETKSPFLRVCRACDQAMERFANALKAGDLDVVQTHYRAGNVNLHHPYTTLPESPYPIHCAAASGNVKVLQWLVEEQHCLVRDMNTGEHLTNAAGHTVLAVAALRGDKATMLYCVNVLRCSAADVTDVTALQRGLHAALEAPGPLPSLTLRRAAAAPTTSVRRYEKLQASNSEPSPTPSPSAPTIRTDTLLSRAAELNNRLTRSSSTSTMTSPARPPLPPSGSTPVTPLGGASATAVATLGVATVATAADAVAAPAKEPATRPVTEPTSATDLVVETVAETSAAITSTASEPPADPATNDGAQTEQSTGTLPAAESVAQETAAPSSADALVPTSEVPTAVVAEVEEPQTAESAAATPAEETKEPLPGGAASVAGQGESAEVSVPPQDEAAPAAADTPAAAKGDPSNRAASEGQTVVDEPAVPSSSAAAESSEVSEQPVPAAQEGTSVDREAPDAASPPSAAPDTAADNQPEKLPESETSTGAPASPEGEPEPVTAPLAIDTSGADVDGPATESEAVNSTGSEVQPSPSQASPAKDSIVTPSPAKDSIVAPSPPKSGSPRQISSKPRQSPQGPPAGLRRLNSMKTEPPLTKAPSVRLGMPGGAGLPRAQSYRVDNGALTSPPK